MVRRRRILSAQITEGDLAFSAGGDGGRRSPELPAHVVLRQPGIAEQSRFMSTRPNQITLDRSRHVRQMPSGRKMGGRVAANQRTSSLKLENAPPENIDYFCFVLPISLFKLHNN